MSVNNFSSHRFSSLFCSSSFEYLRFSLYTVFHFCIRKKKWKRIFQVAKITAKTKRNTANIRMLCAYTHLTSYIFKMKLKWTTLSHLRTMTYGFRSSTGVFVFPLFWHFLLLFIAILLLLDTQRPEYMNGKLLLLILYACEDGCSFFVVFFFILCHYR